MKTHVINPAYNHYRNLPAEEDLINPLVDIGRNFKEINELVEFYKLGNEYYSPEFGIKYLLGTNIYPYQMATIRAILGHKFPMLLFTRGGGKCIVGDSLVFTDNGILKMEECFGEYNGQNGHIKPLEINIHNGEKLCKTSLGICNKKSKTIKIKTCRGIEIEGTPEHKIRVAGQNSDIIWKRLDEIHNRDNIVLSRNNNIFGKENSITEEEAHYLGLLTGDGCLSRDNLVIFSSKDEELITVFRYITKKLFDKDISGPFGSGICDYKFYGKSERKILLEKYGMKLCKSYDKDIPLCIRKSQKHIISSFIKGLFDTDGTVGCKSVDFCTTSITLIKQLQILLLNFGIICRIREKKTKSLFGKVYILIISSNNIDIFAKEIGFCCERKKIKMNLLLDKKRNTNIDIIPNSSSLFISILNEIKNKKILYDNSISVWRCLRYGITYYYANKILAICNEIGNNSENVSKLKNIIRNNYFYSNITNISESEAITYDFTIPEGHSFVSNGIISHNTFILAVYAIYHSVMFPGSKVVLVSASFRQSKLIFSEIDKIYHSSPLLRAISEDKPRISTDHCHYEVCGSSIKALPLGTGSKIRGERGHVILADEFNSIPIEVFDVVVRGFGATQADPWMKTRETMIKQFENNIQEGINKDKEMAEFMLADGNRIVLSGTAGFKNGTFYRMFSQYQRILAHRVKGKAIDYKDIFKEEIDDDHEINYEDYCVLIFNYLDLPPGMMDIKIIDHARATMPSFLFDMEYMCKFADDSYGFFKMKDIESATAPRGGFTFSMQGSENRRYIVGVDPARTVDRFAIVVIEIGSPNKLVYVWTCQNKPFSYSAAKLREILRNFKVSGIAMDEGGGGLAIEELINKSDVMKEGEKKIYRFDDESEDAKLGQKILWMFNFSSNWIDEANTLLQKNLEDRVTMFPYPLIQGEFSEEKDDVLFEINQLKQELIAIEVTHTKSGKKHYDLAPPNLRKDSSGVIKHKDRYSALILANYLVSRFGKLTTDEKAKQVSAYEKTVQYVGWMENIPSS